MIRVMRMDSPAEKNRQRREVVLGRRRELEEGPTGTDLDPLVLLGADTDLPFGQGPNDFEQASRRCSSTAGRLGLCWTERANAQFQIGGRQPEPVRGSFDQGM